MPIYNQASFKNSRIASRKPTTFATTYDLTIAVGPGNTLISPGNPNRTYITLRSEATTSGDDIRYDYFDNPLMMSEGFLLKASEAVDLEAPQPIYARATTNPVPMSVDEGQG